MFIYIWWEHSLERELADSVCSQLPLYYALDGPMAQRNIKEYYYIEYNMYLIFNTIPLALSHKASEREITISYNSCCCLQIISLKCRLWRLNLLIPILRWLSNWTMILSSILRSWNYGTSIKLICWIQLHSYKCQANGKAAFVFHFLCTNVTLIPVYAFFFWHGYIGIFLFHLLVNGFDLRLSTKRIFNSW